MNNRAMVGFLIIFFFLSAAAYAKSKQQSQAQKPLSADDIVAKMKTQLRLTDEQAVNVKPIIQHYLAQEQQVKVEEKKQLGKVLTGDQMFTWNFLQNEPPPEKKKHSSL